MSKEGDGANDYMTTGATLLTAFPFTISLWAWLDQRTTLLQTFWQHKSLVSSFLQMGATKNGQEWFLKIRSTTGVNQTINVTAGSPDTGAWHHLCAWCLGSSNRKLYVDYSNVGSSTASRALNFSNPITMFLAKHGTISPSQFANGRVAEVGIYNIDLSVGEIKSLAKGYSPLFIRRSALVEYYPFIRDVRGLVLNTSVNEVHSPPINTHPPIIYPCNSFIYEPSPPPLPSEDYHHLSYLPRFEFPLSGRLIG